jgi:chromosome segregation ATPase
VKENSDGNDTNVGSIGNSIEEDIKIVEKLINTMKSDRELFNEKTDKEIYTFFINALEHILSDYKRVLKENEILKEEKEQAWEEWNNLEQGSYGTEQKLKQQIKELRKENEELNNRCRNLDKEAQAYLEELAGDNTLTRRTIKQLQEENEELKNKLSLKQFDVNIVYNDYLEKLDEYERNNIPKQKVKDKIEELEKDEYSKYYYMFLEERDLKYTIQILQELLEGRE